MAIFVLALAVIGLILLGIEAFLPGFGVAGVVGLVVELVSIVLTGVWFGVTAALLLTAVVLLIGGTCIGLSIHSVRSGRLSRSDLVLNATEKDFSASDSLREMEGQVGTVVAALRPIGVADFKGDRYEVRAEGEFIPTGTQVVVIRVEGNKMTVRPADAEA